MPWQARFPRKWMAAGALVRDGAGRVLMVAPTYKPEWEIPGGIVEADESPRQACVREVREELGLQLAPGRLLVWEWQGPEGARTESLMFVFDGGVLPDLDAVSLQAEELASARFVDPAQLDTVTVPRLVRRVRAALRALESGQTVELEHGTDTPAAAAVWRTPGG
jgi:8-oxo-dGTP pyrophosphatase MutT (NUDIX family)